MNSLSLRCIRFAFVALAGGIGLGVWFAIDRAQGALLRPLHAELNLWGWATLLIYGMGYHMLPRFAGRALVRVRLANLQSWLAIGGVALVTVGLLPISSGWRLGSILLLVGGTAQLAAAALFTLLLGELLVRPAATP